MSSGTPSEILFDYEATDKGFIVSRPVVDTQYDRLIDNGESIIKVQIKSTTHKKRNRWHVKACRKLEGSFEIYGKSIDVLAVHIKPENKWVFFMSSDIKARDLYVSTEAAGNWAIFDTTENKISAIRMFRPIPDNKPV